MAWNPGAHHPSLGSRTRCSRGWVLRMLRRSPSGCRLRPRREGSRDLHFGCQLPLWDDRDRRLSKEWTVEDRGRSGHAQVLRFLRCVPRRHQSFVLPLFRVCVGPAWTGSARRELTVLVQFCDLHIPHWRELRTLHKSEEQFCVEVHLLERLLIRPEGHSFVRRGCGGCFWLLSCRHTLLQPTARGLQ